MLFSYSKQRLARWSLSKMQYQAVSKISKKALCGPLLCGGQAPCGRLRWTFSCGSHAPSDAVSSSADRFSLRSLYFPPSGYSLPGINPYDIALYPIPMASVNQFFSQNSTVFQIIFIKTQQIVYKYGNITLIKLYLLPLIFFKMILCKNKKISSIGYPFML